MVLRNSQHVPDLAQNTNPLHIRGEVQKEHQVELHLGKGLGLWQHHSLLGHMVSHQVWDQQVSSGLCLVLYQAD